MSENKRKIKVPVMAKLAAEGKQAEYLFWVGSAGSYDDRAKKITRAFVQILDHAKVDYAILGSEETDTGDSAKRAGSEFIFQMQALQNIEVLNTYNVKKIVTCDPHDYNVLKNEYPELGGEYEVVHHTQLIQELIEKGSIKIDDKTFNNQTITFHDPCYLGRGNGEYDAPRYIINKLNAGFTEMSRNKQRSLCCGAGGSQMFKEAESGDMEVYALRTKDAIETKAEIIATACPFCMTMMSDGLKMEEKQEEIKVLDIAEIISKALDL